MLDSGQGRFLGTGSAALTVLADPRVSAAPASDAIDGAASLPAGRRHGRVTAPGPSPGYRIRFVISHLSDLLDINGLQKVGQVGQRDSPISRV